MDWLVIHITYRCNGRCPNCSNLCAQAPSREDIPLEQLKQFLAESVELNYPWKRLYFQGGECSLYPQIDEACRIFAEYKEKHNKEVELWFCTNGTAVFTHKKIKMAEQFGFIIENSNKTMNVLKGIDLIPYIPMNEAPIDVGEPWTEGCFQSSECGIAMTRDGYWECAPAASSARVFHYKPLATSLKELTVEKLQCGFKEHCKNCGFAMPNRRRVLEQTTTATWAKALADYKNRPK